MFSFSLGGGSGFGTSPTQLLPLAEVPQALQGKYTDFWAFLFIFAGKVLQRFLKKTNS